MTSSLQQQVDAVKTAVVSTSTCTPTTVATLKRLLLSESTDTNAKSTITKTKSHTRAKSTPVIGPASKGDELSQRDRMALATHVINLTIKTLADAAKPQPATTPAKQSDTRQSPGKRRLRRSLSTPLSPLQTRNLNRVATSPIIATKTAKTNSVSNQSAKCLPTVECARVAFACMRSIKGPIKVDTTDFQIETGMSALVTKLLALGLNDYAAKELRILKRRLEKAPVSESTEASLICDLMDYNGVISQQSFPTIAACQIQALKLIAAWKKPAHIEAILPFVVESNSMSPFRILSKLGQVGESHVAKAARQMASLSQTLLSLAPSVSSNEDDVAMEPRLSPSPIAAFELQSLAFKAQLRWWKLAGHQGKIDEELLSPYARCIKCFIRRQAQIDGPAFQILAESFNEIFELVRSQGHQPSATFGSPLTSIYQSLGTAAQGARQYEEAYQWFSKLKGVLLPDNDSSVRSCCVSARLLAVALKRANVGPNEENLTEQVIEGLNASLSGTAQEVNELLESLSLARRSVAGLLMNNWGGRATISTGLQDLLKKFLLNFPRFVLRWLGHHPGKDASPKHILQFDQRRQIVIQLVNQVLDGTLMIIKNQIQSNDVKWEAADDVLHDCNLLLDGVHDPSLPPTKLEMLSGYYVKLSTLYFSIFSQLRKKSDQSKTEKKQMFQALNRSIEIVKGRSATEKEKAHLATKLELMADLCKGAGRKDDAVKTLRYICTNMVEDGVLEKVAAALAEQPPRLAWSGERASALSRTLRSIAKLDDSLNDWTFFLPEAQRAAVLEHLLHIGTEEKRKPLGLHDPGMAALLRIFTPERYPIRRFRVLLMLFTQQIGQVDGVDDIPALVDQALRYLQKKDLAEDASLVRFVPHLRNYHTFTEALVGHTFPVSVMKDCISTWKTMVAPCETKADILNVIDDPEALLDQFFAVNQLASLRGESHIQLSISELCIRFAKTCSDDTGDDLILHHCHLASQYVEIGLFTQASKTLDDAKQLIKGSEKASQRVLVDYHLSQAGYFAGIDQVNEAMNRVMKASKIHSSSSSSWAPSKSQATLLRSQALLMQSDIALQKGDIQEALHCVRSSVKWLSHEWNSLEGPSMSATAQPEPTLAETVLGKAPPSPKPQVFGTKLWAWASPLLKSLMHISSVYSHIGMYQETFYFAEAAMRVAEGTQSSLYVAESNSWLASVYVRAGKLEKALPCLEKASERIPQETCAGRVRLSRRLGELYRELGEEENATKFLKMAEESAQLLGEVGQPTEAVEKAKEVTKTTAKHRATARKTAATRTSVTRTTRTRTTTTAVTTKVARRGAIVKTVPPQIVIPSAPKDVYQSSLLASIILSRAAGFMQQQDWPSVALTLELAKDLPKLSGALRQERLIIAARHISLSMEEMIQDPVFSVMQDSTISFPAVSVSPGSPRRPSFANSPPRKGRAAAVTKATKAPAFAETLKQAQGVLLEAQASALASGDNALLHRVSTLLQSTVISLTAASNSKDKATIRSDLTTVAVELARNAAWRREQLTLQKAIEASSPSDLSGKMSGLSLTADMASFQNEFIELVPKNWSVISMSLSENKHDLCITKFQAGHSPFILRLPLERANSRDADSEVFNFEQGREELFDIIKLANETSHSSKDLTTKASRNAWWTEREELDGRLKDLLAMIENTWLGGFKGMFSQHQRRPDYLARFQKSFHKVLDGSLPSRNTRGRGKKSTKATPITLDPRILDLFIGLGDPNEPDAEFDEALNDLLYFVVDILQFHGERNAYDEIDFDAMVVEVYDALKGYFQAVKCEERRDSAHTVLVLDKALHAFPWESMSCMEGLAVSRVPSLECLRRLISEAKMPKGSNNEAIVDAYRGHYVSSTKGTYILNPSSDLKNTQIFFESSFTQLNSWTSIVKQTPTEEAFEQALSTSDILLYFGHGGGAQYIRGKTIRKLEKCKPATFLMGCSSAALNHAGEFEPYGPVWNYLMAGCPAVVGTLWDVTDRDIDRFAGKAFEEWGLFPRGTFKDNKEKSKARDEDVDMGDRAGDASLAEAVARAKGVCKMKYLNAAAVVMYGIPVYIEREG